MALSSNSVFHFTPTISALKGILKDNFKVKYCRETIRYENKGKSILVPIVSFCDIPLSQIKNHIDSYGSYGIGLKKEWALKSGLNPVLYIERCSSLSKNIVNNVFKTIVGDKTKISDLDEIERLNLDYIRYLKNYEADLDRKGKKRIRNYRYSDEREWRYVLNPLSDCNLFRRIKSTDDVTKIKERLNKKAEKERLVFDLDDINYIIVSKESQRDQIINKLEDINNNRYSLNQVKRLTSRIISVEQIKSDF